MQFFKKLGHFLENQCFFIYLPSDDGLEKNDGSIGRCIGRSIGKPMDRSSTILNLSFSKRTIIQFISMMEGKWQAA